MRKPKRCPAGISYYDLKKNWRKVRPHLSDPALNDILVENFNKFTSGRWNKPFSHGQYPHEFESCDWWCDHKGRMPAFWKYTKHSACHWLVNFTLKLAQMVMPDREWRIITSQKHSTAWDGRDTLFDFNFQAMGITADECFRLAYSGRELRPGQFLTVHTPEHFSVDVARAHRQREKRRAHNGVAAL